MECLKCKKEAILRQWGDYNQICCPHCGYYQYLDKDGKEIVSNEIKKRRNNEF